MPDATLNQRNGEFGAGGQGCHPPHLCVEYTSYNVSYAEMKWPHERLHMTPRPRSFQTLRCMSIHS